MVGEALFVAVAGVATGLVTVALLQILAGVFDPPADQPTIPFALIAGMTCVVAVALGVALVAAERGLGLSVVAALRER